MPIGAAHPGPGIPPPYHSAPSMAHIKGNEKWETLGTLQVRGLTKPILIAPRLCRPAIPHVRSLIQGDAPVLRRRHPIDVPAAQPCALGEMSPPHHSVLVMAGLGWLEQGHARSVTIAAAQSSQGSLAESLAFRVCFT